MLKFILCPRSTTKFITIYHCCLIDCYLHALALYREAQSGAKNIKENYLNMQQQICETSSALQKRFSEAAQMERATTTYCHATGRDVACPIRDGMVLMAQSATSDHLGCPFLFIYCFLIIFLACIVFYECGFLNSCFSLWF